MSDCKCIVGQLNPYPVAGCFGNIFTDLLGRETKRTNLWREGGRGTNFTTSGPQVAVVMYK